MEEFATIRRIPIGTSRSTGYSYEENSMMAQQSTVVGVFEDRLQADRAVDALRRAGFRDNQIGVALRFGGGVSDTGDIPATTEESHAGTGAVAGALTGLGLGALAGLGVISGVIPVIGPAIAGGTLGVILTNAAAGAGIGGVAGALIGAGIPEDEAQYYQGEFEEGRAIVTVHPEGRADEVRTILSSYGAYDMGSRGNVRYPRTMEVPVRSQDVVGDSIDQGVDLRNRPDTTQRLL
jgi:hypothetical protein